MPHKYPSYLENAQRFYDFWDAVCRGDDIELEVLSVAQHAPSQAAPSAAPIPQCPTALPISHLRPTFFPKAAHSVNLQDEAHADGAAAVETAAGIFASMGIQLNC